MRRARCVLLLGVLLVPVVSPPAGAAPRGDVNHNGNGTHNHNSLSIRSPTRNSGYQVVSNANAGGVTTTRNASCKWMRHCVIHQREVIFLP
jgi:hypothetical protein